VWQNVKEIFESGGEVVFESGGEVERAENWHSIFRMITDQSKDISLIQFYELIFVREQGF
jgi:hypothetical protein